MLILQGPMRLRKGELVRLNVEKFSADVRVDGQTTTLPYESICKFKEEK